MLSSMKAGVAEDATDGLRQTASRSSQMAFFSPGSHKSQFEQWVFQRSGRIEVHAEMFKEDFNLSNMPAGWDVCPYVDEKDGRILFIEDGLVFAYSFGALIFCSVRKEHRLAVVERLRAHFRKSLSARVTSERFAIEVDNGGKPEVIHNAVRVDHLTPERLATITLTLAQSVSMEYYENVLCDAHDKTMALLIELKKKGKVSISSRKLSKEIAGVTLMEVEVVGVLHLLDKPDTIWNDQPMDAVYEDLRAAFDLPERFKAIEYKVDIVRDTMRIIMETRHSQMALRLEWAVMLLVLIEVIYSTLTRFNLLGFGGTH